jgi:myo-inositol-1(or 4)-monophosphatase
VSEEEEARALAVAVEAAGAAGEECLRRRFRLDPRAIRSKSARRDLVSEADLAAEAVLLERIRRAFPGDAILAEESGGEPPSRGACWCLDPLDGTTNFVHGLPEFSVSVARLVDGVPRVGVVHAPALGETFAARAGAGATRNGEPMRVSATGELADSLLATGFPYRRAELGNDNLENFGRLFHEVRDLRRLGSAALDLAFVACGRFDGYWELHLGRHDVAAGGLLVGEAGGRVTDLRGGETWTSGRSVLATNGRIHDALRARLRD